MIERLVFGCARLAGGVSEKSSASLLVRAFDRGVRAVDVAPSYGLGLAECVVARATRDRPEVAVHAKLGSARDARGWAMSVARAAKRSLRRPAPMDQSHFVPLDAPPRYDRNGFAVPALRDSFAVLHRRLPRISSLLLHDCGPEEFTGEVRTAIETLAREAGATPGYANSAMFEPSTDAAFPQAYAAEAAVRPEWFTGQAKVPDRRPLLLHSIVPTSRWRAARDADFAGLLHETAARIGGDEGAAMIAAAYALLAANVPCAGLIFASTDRDRLDALLGAFERAAALDLSGGRGG